MRMMVAIDYTASNGNPSMPTSRHFTRDPKRENPYQKAIKIIGNVLAEYDSDQRFPVFGYGARARNEDGSLGEEAMDFFELNEGEEVEGIDGILQAYKEVFPKIALSGPTNFTSLIRNAAEIAHNEGTR
jgi:hypothetical protein